MAKIVGGRYKYNNSIIYAKWIEVGDEGPIISSLNNKRPVSLFKWNEDHSNQFSC